MEKKLCLRCGNPGHDYLPDHRLPGPEPIRLCRPEDRGLQEHLSDPRGPEQGDLHPAPVHVDVLVPSHGEQRRGKLRSFIQQRLAGTSDNYFSEFCSRRSKVTSQLQSPQRLQADSGHGQRHGDGCPVLASLPARSIISSAARKILRGAFSGSHDRHPDARRFWRESKPRAAWLTAEEKKTCESKLDRLVRWNALLVHVNINASDVIMFVGSICTLPSTLGRETRF